MGERRILDFARLDEVMPDVERLLAGHRTVGRWTLGQILSHLKTAIRLTAMAPGSTSEPTREEAVFRRLFFRGGRFPEGLEIPLPEMIPLADLDPRARLILFERDRGLRLANRAVPRPSPPRPDDR